MKNKRVDALLDNSGVERQFHITHGVRVIRSLYVLSFPVTWDNARELPADTCLHEWIGIILDRINEGIKWEVVLKARGSVITGCDAGR